MLADDKWATLVENEMLIVPLEQVAQGGPKIAGGGGLGKKREREEGKGEQYE